MTADCTLVVKDRKFRVHRAFLAARSPGLRNLLYGQHLGKDVDEAITVNNVTPQVMEIVIRYLYTAEVDLGSTNVFEVRSPLY